MMRFLLFFGLVLCVQSAAATTKLATLFTKSEGIIFGEVESFTPIIAFENAALLQERTISAGNTTFLLASNFDDLQYLDFVENLTDERNETLDVGHKISKMRTLMRNSETDWLQGESLLDAQVSHLVVRFESVQFKKNALGQTEFYYEMSLEIFGTPKNAQPIAAMGFAENPASNSTYLDRAAANEVSTDFSTKGNRPLSPSELRKAALKVGYAAAFGAVLFRKK